MNSPFVWLGAKRAKKAGVGHKGALLDYAARMGLPVPNGGIILHEFYLYALDNGLIRQENGHLHLPDPPALAHTLFDLFRFPRLDKPVAIRSAFSAEDTATSSLAGYFTSKLGVDGRDEVAFTNSLCEVWASAEKMPGEFRRDVLVLEMVSAQQAGVAFSEAAYTDDLVNFTTGLADKLVAGQVAGETLLLPQLQTGEWPTATEPFARRLQLLLRGVRRTFGPGNSATDWRGDWDIEWTDDGEVCWLVQVRPATRPTRRNEAFTFANFKEILPDPPSPYLTSLIMAAAPDLFTYYRQFDPSLPTHRPMIELFAGRPLFNMTLLTDVMRWWGLPTRLVTNSIGGQADGEVGLRWGRFFRKTFVLLKQGWAQARAVTLTQRLTERLRRLVQDGVSSGQLIVGSGQLAVNSEQLTVSRGQLAVNSEQLAVNSEQLAVNSGQLAVSNQRLPITSLQSPVSESLNLPVSPPFAAANETFRQLFVGLVQGMFALTAALSGPLLILRRAGTLAEHSARLRTIGTTLLTDLDPLRAYVVAHPEIQADLFQGDVPDDEEFKALWQVYLAKHGHRGVYETDVARPRYHEAPQPLLQSLAYPSRGLTAPPPRTAQGWLTWPVWWQCGRVMQAREQFRYDVMQLFHTLRQHLLALAEQAVGRGQLPDAALLWLLSLEEMNQLDEGQVFDLDFFARRRHEIEDLEMVDLPDLLHRFDNLANYRRGQHPIEESGPVFGVSLTPGRVRGRAWVLDEPEHQLPGGFTHDQTILVARSVDAGWIPAFNQVAGVIVDIGGDLSHGSIILREMGLPAITNCGRATQTFQTGDEVELDAGRGQARRVVSEQ